MTILLPKGLPANFVLRGEGFTVLDAETPMAHCPRPLRIALVNLMPRKAVTETQIARMLALGPAPVDLQLVLPDGYHPSTERAEHIARFYRHWSDIEDKDFDGIVITGAPVETLPFEAVTYWQSLTRILDWAVAHKASTFAICWAAQAALAHFYAVPKRPLREKRFGVFEHEVASIASPYVQGLAGCFACPVSRHTEVRHEDLPSETRVLAHSAEAGLCLIEDPTRDGLYMFNHLEYDRDTLSREYHRDRAAGRSVPLPCNYFPNDDASRRPLNQWRAAGRTLFGNWLHAVYRKSGLAPALPFAFQGVARSAAS